jgi:hypothetical protein
MTNPESLTDLSQREGLIIIHREATAGEKPELSWQSIDRPFANFARQRGWQSRHQGGPSFTPDPAGARHFHDLQWNQRRGAM